MADQTNNDLFAISGRDLVYLVQQQERLVKSNLLKSLVERQGYKQISIDTFRNKNGEEIKLHNHYNENRYTNINYPQDTGNIIQFIMNRMTPDNQVVVNNDLVNYCVAVEKCLDFENDLLPRKSKKSERKIESDDAKHKGKRR